MKLPKKSEYALKALIELVIDCDKGEAVTLTKAEFGFFPFTMGSLWVTGLAGIIALPIQPVAEGSDSSVVGVLAVTACELR